MSVRMLLVVKMVDIGFEDIDIMALESRNPGTVDFAISSLLSSVLSVP